MIEALFEKFGDLLPLLIFIIIPLLGRVGPWLAKRAKTLETSASPNPTVVRDQLPSETDPEQTGLQAFLRPGPAAEPAQEVILPPIPTPPRHQRKHESLKEHLAHRGKLSMEELSPIPKAMRSRKRISLRAATHDNVKVSRMSHTAWGEEVDGEEESGSQLDASQLRQAMIWHEILSEPVSLRGPGGLH